LGPALRGHRRGHAERLAGYRLYHLVDSFCQFCSRFVGLFRRRSCE